MLYSLSTKSIIWSWIAGTLIKRKSQRHHSLYRFDDLDNQDAQGQDAQGRDAQGDPKRFLVIFRSTWAVAFGVVRNRVATQILDPQI